jgi:hypothetical protein
VPRTERRHLVAYVKGVKLALCNRTEASRVYDLWTVEDIDLVSCKTCLRLYKTTASVTIEAKEIA